MTEIDDSALRISASSCEKLRQHIAKGCHAVVQECVSRRTTYKDKCTSSGNWACWGSSIDDMVDIAVNDFFRIVGGVGWNSNAAGGQRLEDLSPASQLLCSWKLPGWPLNPCKVASLYVVGVSTKLCYRVDAEEQTRADAGRLSGGVADMVRQGLGRCAKTVPVSTSDLLAHDQHACAIQTANTPLTFSLWHPAGSSSPHLSILRRDGVSGLEGSQYTHWRLLSIPRGACTLGPSVTAG
ncbi:hypothetical protein E1301_Tti007883 [Triplophysa tibetana]|uniref:Uncharacterized protein n=1 Tax=Triplophysa tibetana TaxID=1572043 RepID=A0A5A9MYT9_9TELE|nr:hypothetical protein E1301_Tti007883 [Triplophysa tibetana]